MAMSPRLLRPRATGFDPRSIANLAVWLDATKPSLMAQSSDGTTTVSADADPVGYVACQVGGNALQTTANNRPTYRTAVQNGRAVLRFDGTNDSLQIASVSLNSYLTVFVAGAFTTAKPIFIEHTANASLNDGFYIYGGTNDTFLIRRSSTFFTRNASSSTWAGSSFCVIEFAHAGNTNFAISRNGTAESTTAGGGGSNNLANTAVTSALNICSRNQASVFSSGDLGELLIFNRKITETETSGVRRYLAAKWGVTIA